MSRKWAPRNVKFINNFFFNFLSFQFVRMSRSMFTLLAIGVVLLVEYTAAQRRLALPDPRSCANRVRHATYRDARGVAHSYFFSWEHPPTKSLEVDWLDARNICRRHCMDAVSLETPQENEFIKQRISRGNIRYIWTSGRKCNFAGCDRPGKSILVMFKISNFGNWTLTLHNRFATTKWEWMVLVRIWRQSWTNNSKKHWRLESYWRI